MHSVVNMSHSSYHAKHQRLKLQKAALFMYCSVELVNPCIISLLWKNTIRPLIHPDIILLGCLAYMFVFSNRMISLSGLYCKCLSG